MPTVTLNGTTIYPSDVALKDSKIGKTQVTANGGRTFIHRTTGGGTPIFKRQWDLSFDVITETRRAALRTLAHVTTTMAFVDDTGATSTVQTEENAYSQSIAFIALDGSLYYNVSLSLYEA
jgi:hypothetical protein